jgi:hypothetical protein
LGDNKSLYIHCTRHLYDRQAESKLRQTTSPIDQNPQIQRSFFHGDNCEGTPYLTDFFEYLPCDGSGTALQCVATADVPALTNIDGMTS